MTSHCDALVIGGGPAGAVAAALLARRGWSVIVLEAKPFPRRKVCGEYLSATNWELLAELGVADEVEEQAGPEVRRVGLFVGESELVAELPLSQRCVGRWGRALSRERLDVAMLERARTLGAEVRQPWSAKSLTAERGGFLCRAASVQTAATVEIFAPVVIAAHGSWDVGSLPTQPARRSAHRRDLLGFKAHFHQAALAEGLMPLLAFPGGYGGLVHADDGRISISCCVRRDRLEQIQQQVGHSDGEAVGAHITATTAGVRRVLENAALDGRWLSAGPIRPGIRTGYSEGIFRVGNAAGEAHPAVAEGITMAMQSARLLVDHLAQPPSAFADAAARNAAGNDYDRAWRRAFARRIRISSMIAHWAMRPALVKSCLPLIRRFPGLLTWGARWSGKTDFAYGHDVAAEGRLVGSKE